MSPALAGGFLTTVPPGKSMLVMLVRTWRLSVITGSSVHDKYDSLNLYIFLKNASLLDFWSWSTEALNDPPFGGLGWLEWEGCVQVWREHMGRPALRVHGSAR